MLQPYGFISCHSRLTGIPFGVLKNDSGQAGMTKVCVARKHMNTGYSNFLNSLDILATAK
jgi:hypothetical protein